MIQMNYEIRKFANPANQTPPTRRRLLQTHQSSH